MAKLALKRGTTSKIAHLLIGNSSSSTGAGLTGLTSASAGLIAYYIREGDATATAITLAAGTIGTWSSGGFVEVDSAHMPGVYELGLPNAALASGNSVVVMLSGATNMVPVALEIELDAYDPQSTSLGVIPAMQAQTLTVHPTAGTWDHALTLLWALARGKRVNVGNTQDIYSTDGTTKLLTVTYTPSITSPTQSTAVDD